MTGFDSNMLYFRELYYLNSNCRKEKVSDKLVQFRDVVAMEYTGGGKVVVIKFANNTNYYYYDLKEGETLLDFYKKCLIPLPELDTKKKRNRRRVAD